jgi:hypothetical protein
MATELPMFGVGRICSDLDYASCPLVKRKLPLGGFFVFDGDIQLKVVQTAASNLFRAFISLTINKVLKSGCLHKVHPPDDGQKRETAFMADSITTSYIKGDVRSMNQETDEIIAIYTCTDYGCEKFGRVFYLTKTGSLLPNRYLISDETE